MAAGHAVYFPAGRRAVRTRGDLFDLAGTVCGSSGSVEARTGAAGRGVSSEVARGIGELERFGEGVDGGTQTGDRYRGCDFGDGEGRRRGAAHQRAAELHGVS